MAAQIRVADLRRQHVRDRALDLHGRLLAALRLHVRIHVADRDEHTGGKGRQHVRPPGRTRLAGRQHGRLIDPAVALDRVRGRPQRHAIEVHAAARTVHGLAVGRRIRRADPRRHVVPVRVDRALQPLHVVAEARIDRQVRARTPFVLCEDAEVRIRLQQRRLPEGLLELGVGAALKVGE